MINCGNCSYQRVGILLICIGLIGGWLMRSIWNPGFDAIGPATRHLLIDSGLTVAYITRPLVLLSVSLAGAFVAVETHHVYGWLHITTTIIGVVAITYIFKSVLQIPRPSDAFVTLSTYGFPSTHAAAAGSILVAGSFHIRRIYKRALLPVITTAALITGIIAISRIVIGVHTISDVLTGLFVGIGFGMISVWGWTKLLNSYTPKN